MEKKRVGRPKIKTEPTRTINIAVPVSLLEKVAVAKRKYNDNMTEYINHLIAKDIAQNYGDYEALVALLDDSNI